MKKNFINLFIAGSILTISACAYAGNGSYTIVPKAPAVSKSLQPIIKEYKSGNYLGTITDLEALLKKEPKNTYAKYYLALAYTQLGDKDNAEKYYKEVANANDNLALTYYAKKAQDCILPYGEEINTPEKYAQCKSSPIVKMESTTPAQQQEAVVELDEMGKFIESGEKISPEARDKITKERMERKLQESEYLRKQQNTNLQSDNVIMKKEELIAMFDSIENRDNHLTI